MNGEFFAVGIGPGDPELLTIKALKTIEKSDIIVLPDSKGKTNLAYDITKEYIKDKTIEYFDMPMTKDEQELNRCHDYCAEKIAEHLNLGKKVSFLTLGDPTIYSTVMYVHKRLNAKGYNTAVIPGITSFCATGAALNESLCEKSQMLHIIPATFSDLDYVKNLKGNKILMKSGKTMSKVKEKFKGTNSKVVECATMENQKIYNSLEEVEDASYFSIIFIKEEE